MTTPVLSKGQQRKSLSGKKGSVKGLKNVLAKPYKNYWPVLKNDYGAALGNILKRLLPILKRPEIKLPCSKLRKLNKAERKDAKKNATVECNVSYDKDIAKSIVFGINEVTKLLEKDDVSCILLDVSVDPSQLVKHIADMAKDKNIPVMLISFLKKVTLETVGFAAAAIGLKKHVKDMQENYFYTLFEKITELSSELQSTKGPVTLFQDESFIDDECNEDQLKIENIEKQIKEMKQNTIVSTDIYLYRSSKKERVFQPLNTSKEEPKNESAVTDYIALENYKFIVDKNVPSRYIESLKSKSDDESGEKVLYNTTKKVMGYSEETDRDGSKKKIGYKPLKVKRLQGNECRIKATKASKVKKK